MKRAFIFLLASVMAVSVIAQSTQVIKHRMDSTIYEDYYESKADWDVDNKQDFIYDENGNMIESSWYYMENSEWLLTDLTEFTYDENGLITLKVENYVDESSGELVINYKEEYTYTGNQQLALMIETNWNTNINQWELIYKKAYIYNDFWEISIINDYHWDDDTEEWINGDSIVYNYDVNNFIELVLVYEWDNDISVWKENTKKEFICDENGNIISQIISYMNNNTLEWSLYEKLEYAYDANDNPINEIEYEWENSKGWYEEYKYEYNYNLDYDLSEMILPPLFYYKPDYFENINNMPIDYMKYYYSSSWYTSSRATYHYSEQNVTGIPDLSKYSINVYPNPASGRITLDLDIEHQQISFELIDMQGRKVMQQVISNNQNIDIKQLSKGLYFYRISCKNESLINGKIVIK